MARAQTDNRSPALLASGLLHGLALAAAVIAWPHKDRPIDLGSAVPVNIVTQGPVANVRPAEQGLEDVEAQTEDPVAEAPPAPAAPMPAPAPPAPTPAAAAAKAGAAPNKTAAKPAPAFDLDALAATVAKRAAAGGQRSNAARGPARQETAVQARPAIGDANAMVGSAKGLIAAEITRHWNPNCAVEGGASADIRIGFTLGTNGTVAKIDRFDARDFPDPIQLAAADRARRAVLETAPFENVPRELVGGRIELNFNAQKACQARG